MMKNLTLWGLLVFVLGGLFLIGFLLSKTPTPPQLTNVAQPNFSIWDTLWANVTHGIGDFFNTINPFKIKLW